MKPMTTVSFPAGEYKVVPVALSDECRKAFNDINNSLEYDEVESIWDRQLAAVPAIQPSVVVHSGEPVAQVESWTNGSYWRNYKIEWLNDVDSGTKLFTHPPKQAQDNATLIEAKDAARYRYWKNWWMHSQSDTDQLPPAIAIALDVCDLDEAFDAAIASLKKPIYWKVTKPGSFFCLFTKVSTVADSFSKNKLFSVEPHYSGQSVGQPAQDGK